MEDQKAQKNALMLWKGGWESIEGSDDVEGVGYSGDIVYTKDNVNTTGELNFLFSNTLSLVLLTRLMKWICVDDVDKDEIWSVCWTEPPEHHMTLSQVPYRQRSLRLCWGYGLPGVSATQGKNYD